MFLPAFGQNLDCRQGRLDFEESQEVLSVGNLLKRLAQRRLRTQGHYKAHKGTILLCPPYPSQIDRSFNLEHYRGLHAIYSKTS
jgi:hypothetical protein